MRKLTEQEYNVIMQCIEHGKALIADDDFIDPYDYDAQEQGYNNQNMLEALERVENELINHYTK